MQQQVCRTGLDGRGTTHYAWATAKVRQAIVGNQRVSTHRYVGFVRPDATCRETASNGLNLGVAGEFRPSDVFLELLDGFVDDAGCLVRLRASKRTVHQEVAFGVG